ncbi:hypothetical protein NL676_005897 [Syzygium grande]|nr:hypothetical protein NL676_005897 [Syzygium grande]
MERPPALAGRSFIVWSALVAFMDDSKLHRDWFGPCPFSRALPPDQGLPADIGSFQCSLSMITPIDEKEPREKKPEGKGHNSVQPCRPKAPPRKLCSPRSRRRWRFETTAVSFASSAAGESPVAADEHPSSLSEHPASRRSRRPQPEDIIASATIVENPN